MADPDDDRTPGEDQTAADDDRTVTDELTSTGDDRPVADESTAAGAADAFATLGHPLRIDIVATLHEHSGDAPFPFSELYELVDADGTGQFNYHLGELVPQFVSKADDGYELSAAGDRLARAVMAGTYTETPELDPFELDGHCYDCGARDLRGAYETEHFRVECRDCERVVLDVAVPPSLVRGRDPDDFVAAFDRWSQSQVTRATRGLCPDCGGAVEPSVTENTREALDFDLLARFVCTVCGRHVVTSVGAIAARDTSVRAFLDERGESLDDRFYWEIPQYMSGESVEVRSRDPLRLRVSFEAAGDRCLVVVDEALDVVDVDIVTG